MKTDPSLSSMCIHAVSAIERGMCKGIKLTDLNTSPDTRNNQRQHLH